MTNNCVNSDTHKNSDFVLKLLFWSYSGFGWVSKRETTVAHILHMLDVLSVIQPTV